MIPHDCSPKIPEFYLRELRALANSIARQRRVTPDVAEELQQEAILQFLSHVTVKQLAHPSREHWNTLYKKICKPLDHAVYDETRGHVSFDEHPLMLENLEQDAGDPPNWIPADAEKRAEIVAQCRKLLKRDGCIVKKGSAYSVLVKLMGKQIMVSGGFTERDQARDARRELLTNIIGWCVGDEVPESGDPAQRFVALHARGRAQPLPFYGNPEGVMLYLEDFNQRVTFGHRYYVGDAGYERARFAGSREG